MTIRSFQLPPGIDLINSLIQEGLRRLEDPITSALQFMMPGNVVAIGQYTYRTSEEGTNFTNVSIDPAHPQQAGFILHHVFSEVQKASPGRRIGITLEDWQSALIQCVEEMG